MYILYSSLVLLLMISAFFSGSETGMMSINRYRLRHLARKGNPHAIRVSALLERPDRLLGIILIGNTFANVVASAIATIIASHYLGDLGVVIATLLLTLAILIFAETVPKTYAALHPMKVAFLASLPLAILLRLFYFLVWLIGGVANTFLRLFRVKVHRRHPEPLSAEELRTVVHEASGKISLTYQNMLLRILDLEQVSVEDVMVPRHEIHGINLQDDWATILKQITSSPHAFLPFYDENIDQVQGMLNMRRTLSVMQQRSLKKKDLMQLADKVYFVPEGALLNRQLLNFQDQQQSIGLVVDEYGDIQGLVTLQDIVEEIVGEFARDQDGYTRLLKKQKDGSYLVSGDIGVRDLNRLSHWSLPVHGPKTLSGLIIEHLEMIPTEGIATRIAGYPMEIIKVSSNRVGLVHVWPQYYKSGSLGIREE